MNRLKDYYLAAPRRAFALSADDAGEGVLFKKEIAYPGHFVKLKTDSEEPVFELPVDERLMDHWIDVFHKMGANGIDVPVPLGHTTDPERRRGTVKDLRKEIDEQGVPHLYAIIKFNDANAARQLSKSNVSLFMPPDFSDGKGNKYVRPIRHVALTDYPVIPGLGEFEAVAAEHLPLDGIFLSLAEEQDGETDMDRLREIAAQIGLEVPEDADEERLAAMIIEKANGGGTSEEATEEGPIGDDTEILPQGDEEVMPLPQDEEEEDGEFAQGSEGDSYTEVLGMDNAEFEEEQEEAMNAPPAMSHVRETRPAPIAASLVSREAKNRVAELDRFVEKRKINPACAAELKKLYCTEQHVGVALSLETVGEKPDDFERICVALSLLPENNVGTIGEKTGKQVGQVKSPLVEQAAQRNKEYAESFRGRR